jgi:hypothetical protein
MPKQHTSAAGSGPRRRSNAADQRTGACGRARERTGRWPIQCDRDGLLTPRELDVLKFGLMG